MTTTVSVAVDIDLPSGLAAQNISLRFDLSGVDTEGDTVIAPLSVSYDFATGSGSVDLWVNSEGAENTFYAVTLIHTLGDAYGREVRVSERPLGGIALGDAASYSLAERLRNSVIPGGGGSAEQALYDALLDARDAAAASQAAASTSETNAANSAASAANSASNASTYDPTRRFATVALLLASNRAAGGAGTIWQADGFLYREASLGASDHHVTTAGGVKLYVLPGDNGQYHLPAWGIAFGGAGNIAAVSSYLAARAPVLALPVIDRDVPTPKLHLVSQMANGKNFQGFPSAVRHSGNDYILYREGLGHVETPPFGTKARIVCAVRPVAGAAPTSRTVIYSPTDIDPRDPNVLRDDFGNAILVGGKLKVVMFEWAGSYSGGAATAKVFDLDPANIAAGLVNPVTIPSPVQAVKSDVRVLDSGAYAFVGYSLANTCYLVTTTDWTTFTTEEIGPGNEAAFCQTQDGALNVVARAEENFGAAATIFYRKSMGGSWLVQDVLPYTLNAPTLVKGQGIRVISAYPEGNDGWLLFARDKTGRTALTNATAPIGELVAFRSKESFGQTITKFTDRTTVMGTPRGGTAPVGDNHYCSVIASNYSGDLDIYTYAEFKTSMELAATSFYVSVWRVEAKFDGDQGIRVKLPSRRNYISNGAFEQGEHGYDLTNANIAVVADAVTGRKVLRVTDAMTSNLPYFFADAVAGETLFLKAKMRLNNSNLTSGQHVELVINDYSTGSSVLIQTEIPELDPLDFGTDWVDVAFRPFVAPGNKLLISLRTRPGISSAQTEFSEIALSDDYGYGLVPPVKLPDTIAVANVAFGVTPIGGAKASGTYSANIWPLLGLNKLYSGPPMPAVDSGDITVSIDNCLTQGGALRCICTSAVVNADGSVTAHFAVAPGESGTMSGNVTCRITAIIKT